MKIFADKIIEFNKNLEYKGPLPKNIKVINPFKDLPETESLMQRFYKKYYDDNHERKLMIGINPGRHGAAVTGIPFTDTKRLEEVCNIKMESARTHEVSSVFFYDVIKAYGGPEIFYKDIYVNSPFPLAITALSKSGKWINANYYDYMELFEMTKEYMIETMKAHIGKGVDTSVVYVLGKKNAKFIKKLNNEAQLFKEMIVLEHPRYIQQYKFKERDFYIQKYVDALRK